MRIRKLAAAALVLLCPPVWSAGTTVTVSGSAMTVTAPRNIVWADFLGINTDFSDLTNPLLYSPPNLLTMDAVNQQLNYLQALGLNWVRDPMRWELVQTRGDYSVLAANVLPIYQALKSRGMKVDYVIAGTPCWAEGGLVSGCPALTGTMKVGLVDTIPPMSDLGDFTAFFSYLAGTVPQADVLEVWNEQNISSFWQHQSALTPTSSYTAKTLSADYLKLYDAAHAGAPNMLLSTGGFAYFSSLDCVARSYPSGCNSSKFFSQYPKDIKYCYDINGNPQTACNYPDASKTYYESNLLKYSYHLLNGLAPSWAANPPPLVQFHPYVDFEPGQKGYSENYVLNMAMQITSELRGQQGVHNSNNKSDTSPSAFTWLKIPQVWAGEFGVSAQTYATGSSCSSAADKAACGEALQATYGIRYIALASALDVDRMLYFDLSDFSDPNYLAAGDPKNRDAHYGLLRFGATPTPKPLYYALQRFLQITGPSLAVPAKDSFTINAGSLPLYCVRWDKPDGHHLMMYWAPDQTGKSVTITGFPASSATLHQVLSTNDATLSASGGTLTLPAQDAMQILEW